MPSQGTSPGVRSKQSNRPKSSQGGQGGQEQVDVAGGEGLAAGFTPPEQNAEGRGQAGGSGRQTRSPRRSGQQQRGQETAQGQADLVGCRLISSAGQEEKQLGGTAAAVEDWGLWVSSLETGVVAARGAALDQRLSAEVAVIEVQRMSSGEDGDVAEQVLPAVDRAEQGQRQPTVPKQQGRQKEEPAGAEAFARRSLDSLVRWMFHGGRMVTQGSSQGKTLLASEGSEVQGK